MAQVWSCYQILELPINRYYIAFVGCSVLLVYNLHREIIVRKTTSENLLAFFYSWDIAHRKLRHFLLVISLLGTVILLFFISHILIKALLFILIPVALYLLPFSKLRQVRSLKIFTLAFCWWLTIAVVPVIEMDAISGIHILFFFNLFLLLLIIALAFNLKDVAKDRTENRIAGEDWLTGKKIENFKDLENKFAMEFYAESKKTKYICYVIATMAIGLNMVLIIYFNHHFSFGGSILAFIAAILFIAQIKQTTSENFYLIFIDGLLVVKPITLLLLQLY